MSAFDFEGNGWDEITEAEKRAIVNRLVRERDALADDEQAAHEYAERLLATLAAARAEPAASEGLRAAAEAVVATVAFTKEGVAYYIPHAPRLFDAVTSLRAALAPSSEGVKP